jgi:hypothetical protein
VRFCNKEQQCFFIQLLLKEKLYELGKLLPSNKFVRISFADADKKTLYIISEIGEELK